MKVWSLFNSLGRAHFHTSARTGSLCPVFLCFASPTHPTTAAWQGGSACGARSTPAPCSTPPSHRSSGTYTSGLHLPPGMLVKGAWRRRQSALARRSWSSARFRGFSRRRFLPCLPVSTFCSDQTKNIIESRLRQVAPQQCATLSFLHIPAPRNYVLPRVLSALSCLPACG